MDQTTPYTTNTFYYLSLIIDKYKDIKKEDDVDLFKCIRDIIHVRHDILHLYVDSLCTDSLMRPRTYIREYNLKQIFNMSPVLPDICSILSIENSENVLKLTPDLILYRETGVNTEWSLLRDAGLGKGRLQTVMAVTDWFRTKDIYVIDVSVTSSLNQRIREKDEKYSELCSLIKRLANSCNFRVFAVSVSLSTLHQELTTLQNDLSMEFAINDAYMAIASLMDSAEGALEHIKQLTNDRQAVEFFMMREYGNNEGMPYNDTISQSSITNREKVSRMYEIHMTHKDDTSSLIDEMPNDGEPLAENRILELLKSSLESTETDGLYELKTNYNIIDSVLLKISNKIKENQTSKIRPSIHTFLPFTNYIIPDKMIFPSGQNPLEDHNLEQQQIIKLLTIFSNLEFGSDLFLSGLSDLTTELLKPFCNDNYRTFNTALFNKNIILSEEFDNAANSAYSDYKQKARMTKHNILPKLTFIKNTSEAVYTQKLRDAMSTYHSIIPCEDETRAFRQKIIKVNMNKLTPSAREILKQNHSGIKSIREYKPFDDSSIPPEMSEFIDDVLDRYSTKENLPKYINDNLQSTKSDKFVKETISTFSPTDNHVLTQLKKTNTEDICSILDEVRTYPAYWQSFYQFLTTEQLCHFTQYTLPTNTFSIFTSGIPNVAFLVQNSYHDSGKDVGKSFLSFGYTDNLSELSPVYGKIYYQRLYFGDRYLYFFCTNWRRLSSTKLTFVKDQFFSTLSTGLCALLRHKSDIDHLQIHSECNLVLRHHYTLKTVVGNCTNQKTAEMLADMRYAIMSSFSEFSRIDKFIEDKFNPPFRTCFDIWIFKRLYNIRDFVKDIATHRSNMRFRQPKFIGNQRTEDSIGGEVMIPSVWDNHTINDLQDILDDLFLYVHTAKEPSSIHYENVKSIKTILKFQSMYNNLNSLRKKGDILSSLETLNSFFNDNNIIGHSSDIVQLSARFTLKSMSSELIDDLFTDVLNEPLSNITSTKAAIPEYKREVIVKKQTRRKIQHIRDHLESVVKNQNPDEYKNLDKSIREMLLDKIKYKRHYGKNEQVKKRDSLLQEYQDMERKPILSVKIGEEIIRSLTQQVSVIPSHSHLPGGIRAKVHDCLLDYLENNPESNKVLDLAEWNVLNNESLVHADICIKAQYGAKREFYVINIGAKAKARLLEEFFHKICNLLPNEMISVPGDRKLLTMQEQINKCIMSKKSTHSIYYTNGDCTKWSAAETMECFYSLLLGMKDKIPEEAFKLCKIVIRSWGMKKINIPVSILTNTYKVKEDITDYLETCTDAQLSSSQNFLQGMFNYMSSFKAVCCSNYTLHMWRKMYPDSDLEMSHLEHSDDYVLMISVRTEDEMLKFRKFHRMMMKLHGFNDSEKKTNTQKFLMEFISLASMNGHMTYPQIKKTKEVGLNMGCTGYRDDVDTAMSRVGEAMRIGTPGDACYAMQKIHLANVYRSYSLFEGQRNNVWTYSTMMEFPVEAFGMPDTYPLIPMLAKGNCNNYRLYHFSESIVKKLIETLFSMEIVNSQESSELEDADVGENIRLYHPRYIFNKDSKTIKKIRERLNIEYEDVKSFWDEHKSYNFIKPVSTLHLRNWMKSMYFRSNFTLAYSRTSRAQITLRLSTYTSKACIINPLDQGQNFIINGTGTILDGKNRTEPYNILQYVNWLKNSDSEKFLTKCKKILESETSLSYDVMLLRTLINCDSTIDAIYNMLKTTRIAEGETETVPTVAMLTPNKLLWVSTNNSPSTLLQYIFNPEDLKDDMRHFKSHRSLEADKEAITKHYKVKLNSQSPLSTVKTVFQDIIMSQQRRNLCMGYYNVGNNLDDFIKKHIEYGSSTGKTYKVYTKGITEAVNPHTGQPFFKKNLDLTREEVRLAIDDLTLAYVLLKFCYKVEDYEIKKCLSTMQFKSIEFGRQSKLLLYEELMTYTLPKLQSVGCTNKEIQRFCYMKAVLESDMSDMYEYLEGTFSYMYDYSITFGPECNSIQDQVRFRYLKTDYIGLKMADNTILLLADSCVKIGIMSAYIICLKLFKKIKFSDLEYFITSPTFNNIRKSGGFSEHNYNILSEPFQKYVKVQSVVFSSLQKIENVSVGDPDLDIFIQEKGNPSIFICDLPKSTTDLYREHISKRAELIKDKGEVRTGTSKVYSLPFLDCSQSNLTTFYNDISLSGLPINWWMNQSRALNFIQKGEVTCNQDDISLISEDHPMIGDENMLFRMDILRKKIDKIPNIHNQLEPRDMLKIISPLQGGTIVSDKKSDHDGNIEECFPTQISTDEILIALKGVIYFENFVNEVQIHGTEVIDKFKVAKSIIQDIYHLGYETECIKKSINGKDDNISNMLRSILGKETVTKYDVIGVIIGFMENDPTVDKNDLNWIDSAELEGTDIYASIDSEETISVTILENGTPKSSNGRLTIKLADISGSYFGKMLDILDDIIQLHGVNNNSTKLSDKNIQVCTCIKDVLSILESNVDTNKTNKSILTLKLSQLFGEYNMTMPAEMSGMLFNLQVSDPLVVRDDISHIQSLYDYMIDNHINFVTLDDLLRSVQRLITSLIESGVCEESDRSEYTKRIYEGYHPMEIPTRENFKILQDGHTICDSAGVLYVRDADEICTDILNRIRLHLKLECYEKNESSESRHSIERGPSQSALESHPPDYDHIPLSESNLLKEYGINFVSTKQTIIRTSSEFMRYEQLKDRLNIMKINQNSLQDTMYVNSDYKVDWCEDDEFLDTIRDLINHSSIRDYRLSKTLTEDILVENFTPREKEDIIKGSLDRIMIVRNRLSKLIDRGVLTMKMGITIISEKTSESFVNFDIVDMLEHIEPYHLSDVINDIIKGIHKHRVNERAFNTEYEATDYISRFPSVNMTVEDLMKLSKYELDSLTFMHSISTTDFKLLPLEGCDDYVDVEFKDEDIINESGSDSTPPIKDDRQLTYHELATMEPVLQKKIFVYNPTLPHNISTIQSRGNPTMFVLEYNILNDKRYGVVPAKVKLLFLQKMKFLLSHESKITQKEKILSMLVGEKLSSDLLELESVHIEDDIYILPSKKKMALYYRVENVDDPKLIELMLNDGGIEDTHSVYDSSMFKSIYMPMTTDEVDEFYKENRNIPLPSFMALDLSMLESAFKRVFKKGGNMVNKYKKLYGLSYVPI